MPKGLISRLAETRRLLTAMHRTFKKYGLMPAFYVAVILIFIGLFFIFVSFIQTISPFIYPLF